MILGDLFESRMSELDIEYQDWKNLEPVAFYSRYKMTKDEWASKNWSLIKGGETIHEFAPGNGGEEDLDPEWIDYARNEGYKYGITLDDGHKLQRAFEITAYDTIQGGLYKDYFAQGFIEGRKQKIKNAIQHNLKLTLQKDGSLARAQGVAEVFAPVVALRRAKKPAEPNWIVSFRLPGAGLKVQAVVADSEQQAREIVSNIAPGADIVSIKEKSVKEATAKERWEQAAAERQKKHDEIERKRQRAAKQGKTDVPGAISRLEKALGESSPELSVGDAVIIQGTEYNGKTGDIKEFSPSGKFVVVDLYNYGPQAFHLANVAYNQYADKETVDEEKVRLDPKCWKGKKIGNPKTKMKGGVRVNNCVPVEEEQLDELTFLGSECTKDCSGHRAGYNWSKRRGGVDGMSPWSPSFNKGAALAKAGK